MRYARTPSPSDSSLPTPSPPCRVVTFHLSSSIPPFACPPLPALKSSHVTHDSCMLLAPPSLLRSFSSLSLPLGREAIPLLPIAIHSFHTQR